MPELMTGIQKREKMKLSSKALCFARQLKLLIQLYRLKKKTLSYNTLSLSTLCWVQQLVREKINACMRRAKHRELEISRPCPAYPSVSFAFSAACERALVLTDVVESGEAETFKPAKSLSLSLARDSWLCSFSLAFFACPIVH